MNIPSGRKPTDSRLGAGEMALSLCGRRDFSVSLLVSFASVLARGTSAIAQNTAETKPRETFGRIYQCNAGPWGELRYYYLYLEPPDRVVDNIARPDPATKWCFPGGTDTKLRKLFTTAELPTALQDYLLSPDHRVVEDGVLTVFPPLPDVLAMTNHQRMTIYTELAKSELNLLYMFPSFIFDGDVDAWLAHAELRPELFDAVRKLTYPRGDALCFSDLAAILSMVESEQEAREFIKAMTRTRTLVLQLNLKNASAFDQVVRYWSADGRNEQVATLILPSAEAQGNESLDCVYLLPPLPRRLLNTFSTEELAIAGSSPDCNWTSFNFFSSAPLNIHTDERVLLLQLRQKYMKVKAPYRLGDVLMFELPGGDSLHSCVYIADDIVYTKNGQNRWAPWILSKMKDVERRYAFNKTVSIQGYRLKGEGDEEHKG